MNFTSRRLAARASALLALFGAPAPAQDALTFQTGAAAAERKSAAAIERALAEAKAKAARHVIVGFRETPDAACRAACAAAGLKLTDALTGSIYFAAVDAAASPQVLARSGLLADVQVIDPAWKLDPLANRPAAPEFARVESGAGDRVAAYVLFHPGVDRASSGLTTLFAHGADVVDEIASLNGFVVELPFASIASLATKDEVKFIELARPQLSEANAQNRLVTGAAVAQDPPYGLSGDGVSVMVYDSGTARATHLDFAGRLFARDASALRNHSTHVAGTIGGDGAASSGVNRGMAPGVTIQSYGFGWDLSGVPLYSNPGDLEADYADAIQNRAVAIANNSISSNVTLNNLPCTLMGDYSVTAALYDAIITGSLGRPVCVVIANGNERSTPRCSADGFRSTSSPATAKNAICVGNINSNDEVVYQTSSWGPTDDGRLKPEIVAPGCQSDDDFGVTSTGSASDASYSVLCGTSMSAPTVSGCVALLLEDYRAIRGGPDPTNAMIKAVLAQTAHDLENPGPDFMTGYGSIRIVPAIELMRDGRFESGALDDDETDALFVTLTPEANELRITLAWDDPPAAPNVVATLVNDLDLRLTDPSGGVHYPWTLSAATPAAAAIQTQADRVNNIEQVAVVSPMAGRWKIEVVGHAVPMGPQDFSLTSSLALTRAAPAAGDLNCDGIVSVADIPAFVTALSNPAQYTSMFPTCDRNAADVNGDEYVGVSDIGRFVQLLMN